MFVVKYLYLDLFNHTFVTWNFEFAHTITTTSDPSNHQPSTIKSLTSRHRTIGRESVHSSASIRLKDQLYTLYLHLHTWPFDRVLARPAIILRMFVPIFIYISDQGNFVGNTREACHVLCPLFAMANLRSRWTLEGWLRYCGSCQPDEELHQ